MAQVAQDTATVTAVNTARETMALIAAEAETIINTLTHEGSFNNGTRFDAYTYAGGSAVVRADVPFALVDHIMRVAKSRVIRGGAL
jgi:hypothetical protein